MTTTTTPDQSAEGSTTVAAETTRPRFPRIARILASLAVLVGGLFGTAIITAPAASAAGPMATVDVCFDDYTSYKKVGQPWVRTIYYQLNSGGRWYTANSWSSANGCVRFSVHAGYWVNFQVSEWWQGAHYLGNTGTRSFGANTYQHLGHFRVDSYLVY